MIDGPFFIISQDKKVNLFVILFYYAYMFSDSFFQKVLFDNRKSLLVHAKKLENIYKNKEQDLSDARENWRDLDEVEKYRVLD